MHSHTHAPMWSTSRQLYCSVDLFSGTAGASCAHGKGCCRVWINGDPHTEVWRFRNFSTIDLKDFFFHHRFPFSVLSVKHQHETSGIIVRYYLRAWKAAQQSVQIMARHIYPRKYYSFYSHEKLNVSRTYHTCLQDKLKLSIPTAPLKLCYLRKKRGNGEAF